MGERGEQGQQGPMVPIRIVCIISIVHAQFRSCHSFGFQGYPGEKGSSDIIDFNGELLDAFRVSEIRTSATEVRFTARSCTTQRQASITMSDHSGGRRSRMNLWVFLAQLNPRFFLTGHQHHHYFGNLWFLHGLSGVVSH